MVDVIEEANLRFEPQTARLACDCSALRGEVKALPSRMQQCGRLSPVERAKFNFALRLEPQRLRSDAFILNRNRSQYPLIA
jgi:hypothetical protein